MTCWVYIVSILKPVGYVGTLWQWQQKCQPYWHLLSATWLQTHSGFPPQDRSTDTRQEQSSRLSSGETSLGREVSTRCHERGYLCYLLSWSGFRWLTPLLSCYKKKKRCRHWCHRAQNSTGLVHVRYDMAFVWKKVCVTDWNDLMEFYCHMLRFTYYLIALWEASVFGCVSIAIG